MNMSDLKGIQQECGAILTEATSTTRWLTQRRKPTNRRSEHCLGAVTSKERETTEMNSWL